jgi:hypothetical protein
MAKLSDLGLSNEKVGGDVDFDNLPKTGGFAPILLPGRYRFRLPASLGEAFGKISIGKGPKAGQERLNIVLDNDAPLTIVQAPAAAKDRVGEPFTTRISNMERARGKEKIEVSDLDYLLKALGAVRKPGEKWSNLQYAQALLPFAGKEFTADVEWSWQCREDKDIYVETGEEGGGTAVVEGTKGCGSRYYMNRDVQKDAETNQYPERIICTGKEGQCGASLRAFSNLSNFGA